MTVMCAKKRLASLPRFYSVFFCLLMTFALFQTANATSHKPISGTAIGVLQSKLSSILQSRVCNEGQIGLIVQDLRSGQVLFERNPDLLLQPASNQKIVSTIGALGLLSPQYTFKTSVHHTGVLKDGTVSGDLFITGGGDPYLVKEELWKIAERVFSMGIRHVAGNIVTDSHFFDQRGDPDDDWKRIKMPLWYNAPTGGLAYNFNAISVMATPGKKPGDPVRITVDPPLDYFDIQSSASTGAAKSKITLVLDVKEIDGKCLVMVNGRLPITSRTQTYYRHLKQPEEYTGHAFKYFLEQVGIGVAGVVQSGIRPETAQKIYENESAPLSELLRNANKFSNNFMIEQIIKTIDVEINGQTGTTQRGLQSIKEYFEREMEIDFTGLVLSDGSGLSRLNRITARQFTELIRFAVNESHFGPEFLTCQPIAGVDGTMRRRLTKNTEKNLVRAKTGLINNVVCLTGLVDGRRGEGLVFSILINKNKGRHGESKQVQDKTVEALLEFWSSQNGKHATTH